MAKTCRVNTSMDVESNGTDISQNQMHSESDYSVVDPSNVAPAKFSEWHILSQFTLTEQFAPSPIILPLEPVAEAEDKQDNTQPATDTTFSPKAYAVMFSSFRKIR